MGPVRQMGGSPAALYPAHSALYRLRAPAASNCFLRVGHMPTVKSSSGGGAGWLPGCWVQ